MTSLSGYKAEHQARETLVKVLLLLESESRNQ